MQLTRLFERVKHNSARFGARFPIVGEGKHYRLEDNTNWLCGFWPGLVWLSYAQTADEALRDYGRAQLQSFRHRLDRRIGISHDLGFLYTLSARAQWQLTGDPAARDLALAAAAELSTRYRPAGRYIQAWGPVGDPDEGGRIIIDTMMNLPLLYWAARQTGERHYADIATQHAATSAGTLIRADGSTNHTFFFNQDTGEPLGPKTHQGYADDSLWARGQAWAIFGYAVAGEWSGSAQFLQIATRAAERFMAELPADGLPLWDFRLPPDAPHYPDTSAGAIAAAGMLRLAPLVDRETSDMLRQHAAALLNTLSERCLETDPDAEGLLRGGTYHAHKGWGVDEYFICGDYYFLEALLMRYGFCPDFWGVGTDSPPARA